MSEITLSDFVREEILYNPYPLYRALRDEDPIHKDQSTGNWIVTRHQDVAAVLADKRFSAERLTEGSGSSDREASVMQALERQMLFLDPPDHTRLRGLFTKAFTPHRLEKLRPQIVELANHLFDRATQASGTCDFIREVAGPLPVIVIAQMLGVPRQDWLQLRSWSGSFGRLISGRRLTNAEQREAQDGVLSFVAYFKGLIEQRRAILHDDMLSDLIAAEEQGDRLTNQELIVTNQELIVNLILLFAAGHGTTTHLLGNGLLALLSHREQWSRLAEDPTRVTSAVNELLRFDAPVQAVSREALEDLDLGGTAIRKGEMATVFLGSANRDERHFENPDTLDILRSETRILSFGHGIHTCLGAALAKLEAQVVFGEMVRRFPEPELVRQTIHRLPSRTFRGVQSLNVRLV